MTKPAILVVDTDAVLLGTIGHMLADACSVLTARTAEEALEVLADADRLDAVIVSAHLCEGGVDLMQWASLAHPRARRLTTSGRPSDRLCEVLDAAAGLSLIEHPLARVVVG